MKPRTRFAVLALIPLGCATGENTDPGDFGLGSGGTEASAGTDSSESGSANASAGSSTGGTGTAGTGIGAAGTFGTAGTFVTAGTTGLGGTSTTGGAAGSGGGNTTAGTTSTAGKASGGSPGTAGTGAGTAGTPAAGGSAAGTAYCDTHTKSPLPYTVNEGFQPSVWQGDLTAISGAVVPNACDARAAGSVGICTPWRFTPNATTPAWAGVAWSRIWDPGYIHDPVCLAAGATKITFQARGAAGGEQVTFSAAGAAEVPFTLTNAWTEYQIPLAGVVYNTPAEGISSGFFWKVAPPTPNGAPVTFFVDDIQFVK